MKPSPRFGAELGCLAAAVAIAAAATALIWHLFPDQLSVHTDIVGYPTFRDFNIDRYMRAYELAWFFPLLAVGLYVLFRRLASRGAPREPRVIPVVGAYEPPASPGPTAAHAAAIGRLVLVGAVLGVELVLSRSQTSAWIRDWLVPATLVYAALAAGLAFVLARWQRRPFWLLLATVNAAASVLTVFGLYGVSAATEVRVAADSAVHHYGFFPLWLALATAAVLSAWMIRAWRRQGLAASPLLERRALLVVVGPAALFPFVATLVGELGGFDIFAEGESLAAAQLTLAGAFPWRDLLTIHGPLLDILRPMLGIELWQDSRWAATAGWFLILIPLSWIALYALCAYLFRRNWLFLVGTQIAVVTGAVFTLELRFLLLPVLILLLIALLHEATRLRATAFMAVLVLSVILTPETSIAALAFLATLVCFEFYYRDSARSRAENFRRTILCAASGAILVVVWFAFLAIFAALGSFVFYYLTFAPGHQYTGGFPISLARQVSAVSDARFTFAVVAPVVLAALTFCFFAVRMRFRWPLRVEDWAMGGAALFMALYYTKFLARADHVFESFAVTSPVLFYVVYRAIELLAGRLPSHLRRTGTYGLTAGAIVVTLICAPTPLRQAVRAIPSHFVANAAAEPTMARMGYAVPGAVDPNMVSDLDKITSAYLGPKDTFFDFTNSPGLFSYLLRLPPSTRYYHVSMAIRQRTQSDLISELERRQPKLVIFSSTAAGLPTWDGISNPVRHYDVSQYLLDHYRPLLVSHGYTLMARNGAQLRPPASITGLVERPATGQLSFNSLPCDWGYAPNFLTTGPARDAAPVSVLRARARTVALTLAGWAADRVAAKPASEVVAAIGPRVVGTIPVVGDRPDVAASFSQPGIRYSGFNGTVSVPTGAVRGVRFYGLTSDGRATELGLPPGPQWQPATGNPPSSLTLPDGSSATVVSTAVQGWVDSIGAATPALLLDRPANADRYHWLEIEARTPFHADSFALADRANLGNAANSITFNTTGRGARTVRVQIGACSQWRGYRGPLYLSMNRLEDIKAVRLLR